MFFTAAAVSGAPAGRNKNIATSPRSASKLHICIRSCNSCITGAGLYWGLQFLHNRRRSVLEVAISLLHGPPVLGVAFLLCRSWSILGAATPVLQEQVWTGSRNLFTTAASLYRSLQFLDCGSHSVLELAISSLQDLACIGSHRLQEAACAGSRKLFTTAASLYWKL